MAKKSESVGLERGERPKRRFPWWIVIVVIVLLILAAVGYLFQRQIGRLFEPKPTAAPPPPGASGGQLPAGVLYQDNFDDTAQDEDWSIFDDGTISSAFQDGRLVVGVKALSDTGGWSGMNFTFDDFKLDVDATKIDGPDDNGIMVIFRSVDKMNYNRFDISSDGYYAVSKVRDGIPTTVSNFPIMPNAAIKTGGETNHITVVGRGGTFSFLVNGTPLKLCISSDPNAQPLWDQNGGCIGGNVVDSWQNTDFMQGKIGLGAQAFVPHSTDQVPQPAIAVIAFDNLVVKTPDTP